jgi:single-strand DNA-binding protein
MNKVILVGNCTKDGELRYTQNGTGIYLNSIATTRKYKVNNEQKEEVMFIDFKAFSKLSEICNQYLKKGSKILIEGRLVFEQWQDEGGNKKSKHTVSIENMQMLDSKPQDKKETYSDDNKAQIQKPKIIDERKTAKFPEIEDDSEQEYIPF